jgi:2-amino-4-hydroxy-6-hydroxymethyldihydropteridine diphosphokinase
VEAGIKKEARIFLLLGSNLGDRYRNLLSAHEMICTEAGKIINASHIYLTEAWGAKNQPDFFNQAIEIKSGLTPEKLLRVLNRIELTLGRKKNLKWEPRIIDLDILFYNEIVFEESSLQIPHPLISKRNFVLIPLMEIAADFKHPYLGKTVEELYIESKDPLEVIIQENYDRLSPTL